MKAEKFLNRLGLSVNIVIVILLLVIVYLLYCINDNLSMDLPMEYFNVGGQFGGAQRTTECSHLSGPQKQICIQQRNDRIRGVSEEEQDRRQRMENQAATAAAAAADRQANRNTSQAERQQRADNARMAEATAATIGSRVAPNLKKSRNNGTAYIAKTSTGQNRSQNVQNNKARRQEIGRAQAADAAAAAAGGGLRTNNPGTGTSNAAIRAGTNSTPTSGGGQ